MGYKSEIFSEGQVLTHEHMNNIISGIDLALNSTTALVDTLLTFETGTIDSTTGVDKENTSRIRTDFIQVTEKSVITFTSAVSLVVLRYDSSKAYIDNTTGNFEDKTILNLIDYMTDNCNYIRLIASTSTIITDAVLTAPAASSNSGNSLDLSIFNKYRGKKMSILGDSISTYVGTIPEGNRDYYYGNNLGVDSMSQMWWCIVKDTLGMELLVNNSWAGRCVASTRDNEASMLNSAGARDTTVSVLKTDTASPDVIFVRLGTNDFSYKTPLGNYNGTTDLTTDITTFSSAYANMLTQLTKQFPNAEIWCCTIPPARRTSTYPSLLNNNSILQFNQIIENMCDLFGCHVVYHSRCGINWYAKDTFGDWSASGGTHPNAKGQRLLAEQTLRDMMIP